MGIGEAAAANFAMLAKSGCDKVASIDDAAEWRDTMSAARMLGFGEDELTSVIDILGALLHLGNAQFIAESTTHGDDCAKLVDSSVVDYAAWLLGADRHALVSGMISYRVKTARDDLKSRMSAKAAEKNRDAFVAALYAGLFDWIVRRVNACSKRTGDMSAEGETIGRFIGVLDIFGFEIFQTNSFEQLCINFANEKLQRNFAMTTFQAEEGLYTSEGIAFDKIPYIDNQPVLDLLDKLPDKKVAMTKMAVVSSEHSAGLAAKAAARGIIQIIDEEVRRLPLPLAVWALPPTSLGARAPPSPLPLANVACPTSLLLVYVTRGRCASRR